MNIENINLIEHNNLLNKLQGLLKKQIKAVSNSNFNQTQKLIEQSGILIKKISEIEIIPKDKALQNKYQETLRSYKILKLMIETEKDITNKQLTKIKKGKKTIQAYQH